MVISRAESVPLPAQHTPVLSGGLDASGSRSTMAAKEPAAARRSAAESQRTEVLGPLDQ